MAFSPRLDTRGMYNNPYWYSSGNPFYPAYGLPNCTCYAYGRYWEITGINPTSLPRGNAGTWYDSATGFPRGQEPRLGAIACWDSPTGSYVGHVAVVEEIYSNGDIRTSNSGYFRPIAPYPPDTQQYFWTEVCYKNDGYRSGWESQRGYRLKGFIYLDSEPVPDPDIPTEWAKGNRYLNTSEMENNAYITYAYLNARGWSFNAICALLGNMVRESRINPALYESFIESPSSGYGLVQWTPATKYQNWANSHGYPIDDGNYQLQWIDEETAPQGQWVQRLGYNITFDEFKTDTEHTLDYLVEAFCWDFEYPQVPAMEERKQWAEYFYNYLKDLDPIIPPFDPDVRRKTGLKIWQMIRYHY